MSMDDSGYYTPAMYVRSWWIQSAHFLGSTETVSGTSTHTWMRTTIKLLIGMTGMGDLGRNGCEQLDEYHSSSQVYNGVYTYIYIYYIYI